jgi:metal-responsive CopG/Arc/MetJ family transcriptional regulator
MDREYMTTHVRKNITLPSELDAEVGELAKRQGGSQSGVIAHLLRLSLATETAHDDPLLAYVGSLDGPVDLSESVDRVVCPR